MKRNRKELDAVLNDALAAMRNESLESSGVNSAAERVWSRLANESATNEVVMENRDTQSAALSPATAIQNCADFQTLIPAYLHGELSPARTLLLEDHTRECIPCRRALKESRAERNVSRPAVGEVSRQSTKKSVGGAGVPVWRWGIAAALVLCCGLIGWAMFERLTPSGGALHATVYAASGPVYLVSESENRAIGVGDKIGRGEKIRTAKDSTAVVRLADGSLIEMKERSELSLSDGSRGVTVNLARGNVIVQAAKQRTHHLYVATNDCLVSVTGTIFSVNNGTKGSRVSVIEGEVRVSSGGDERVLHPGDQTTTNESLEGIPITQEIAWSRDAERYLKLVGELAALNRELDRNVPRPGVRYESKLLKMIPEGTVLYAALPNMTTTISESYRIMQERIGQNAALSEWWEKEKGETRTAGRGAGLDEIMRGIRECGEYLGEEIVIAAVMDERGLPDAPLVLAELKDTAGFRAFLETQVKTLTSSAKESPTVRFIADPLTVSDTPAQANGRHEILIWVTNDLFAATTKPQQLRQLALNLKTSAANNVSETPFHARISEAYREGAGLLVAADLEKIVAALTVRETREQGAGQHVEAFRRLGLLDLKHFILEHKNGEGKTLNRARLTFNESNRGIASWLAAPGPMGGLEFVSPDANVVAGFVVKDPMSLVGDLLGVVETVAPTLQQHLKELEAKHGLNVRRDFAAPLGGEFVFAIDGPLLPTPSWKMILEVYDPARLQKTLERAVGEVNREAAKFGQKGLIWEQSKLGDRTYYMLRSIEAGVELNYAYVNGYMIVGPSRALIDRAVRFHDSGYTLVRAAQFKSNLPADGSANFSALLYHNLAPVIEPLARRVAEAGGKTSEQGEELRKLSAAASAPTLAYAYANGDQIIFAANGGEGGPFGLGPATLFGLPGSFGIQRILEEGAREK